MRQVRRVRSTRDARIAARHIRIGCAGAVVAAGALSVPTLMTGAPAGASLHAGTTLSVVKTTGSGKVLADGNTVYTLKASSTPCNAACLKIWPAVVLPAGVKKVAAGSGVSASKIGAVKVPGVGMQVTYRGKRLYWYSGDTAPGQVNGNFTDTWGTWKAVALSTSHGSSSSGKTSAGSGGASF